MAVIAATAAMGTRPVAAQFRSTTSYVMAGTAILLVPLLLLELRLSRPRGAVLVLAWCVYVAFLAWRQGLHRAGYAWVWG
jgi:cation:H+ antiporter